MSLTDDEKKNEVDLMRQIIELNERNQYLRDKVEQLSSLLDDERVELADSLTAMRRELASVENSITIKEHELNYLMSQVDEMYDEIRKKDNQLEYLDDELAFQDLGLYRPQYPCTRSSMYVEEILKVRNEQKKMMENYSTFEYGFADREDFPLLQLEVLDIMEMATIAFNCECDILINKADAHNVRTIENKINVSISRLNRLMERFDISLSRRFTDLKMKELHLCHEYALRKKKEETMKFGFLYVLSSETTLGRNVYSIGSTRRLDPVEHIKALNEEISPFMFDIHTIIPSEDVESLRSAVCGAFEKARVASTGQLGDLFNVTLDDIEEQLRLNYDRDFRFDRIYRASGPARPEDN